MKKGSCTGIGGCGLSTQFFAFYHYEKNRQTIEVKFQEDLQDKNRVPGFGGCCQLSRGHGRGQRS